MNYFIVWVQNGNMLDILKFFPFSLKIGGEIFLEQEKGEKVKDLAVRYSLVCLWYEREIMFIDCAYARFSLLGYCPL